MIYSPETKHGIKFKSSIYIIYINYMFSHLVRQTAHSVRADPSSLRPTCPFLLILVHIVSALVEHWMLISLASWEAGPSLTPFPQADPISLRSQVMAHSHVGRTNARFYYSDRSYWLGGLCFFVRWAWGLRLFGMLCMLGFFATSCSTFRLGRHRPILLHWYFKDVCIFSDFLLFWYYPFIII